MKREYSLLALCWLSLAWLGKFSGFRPEIQSNLNDLKFALSLSVVMLDLDIVVMLLSSYRMDRLWMSEPV